MILWATVALAAHRIEGDMAPSIDNISNSLGMAMISLICRLP